MRRPGAIERVRSEIEQQAIRLPRSGPTAERFAGLQDQWAKPRPHEPIGSHEAREPTADDQSVVCVGHRSTHECRPSNGYKTRAIPGARFASTPLSAAPA